MRASTVAPTPAQRLPGVASDVDHVGTIGAVKFGRGDDLVESEPRGVVDLGEDLDVERTVTVSSGVGPPEEPGKVAEVFGAEIDRGTGDGFDRRKVAAAVTGQDDAVDPAT